MVVREASAGGVVVRRRDGEWWVAVIEPAEKRVKTEPRKKAVFALPKGLIDPGEKAVEAAVREVREEAGLVAEPVRKLADNRYIYVRTWGGREKVSKIVSFYLMRYLSGRINHISEEMRGEVRRASWVKLQEAPGLLAYGGERQVARKALAYLTKAGGLRPGQHSEI
jgi:8-oxo-dGTP pyrophosphatase MutT (NUDIX family)